MSKYSHRNGEMDEPTVAGWYWFDGVPRWKHSEWEANAVAKRTILITIDDEGDRLFWYGGYDDADYACADGWLQGQWWGPIVAPWQAAQSSEIDTPGVPAIPAEVLDAIGILVAEGDENTAVVNWDWIGGGEYLPQVQLLRKWLEQAERGDLGSQPDTGQKEGQNDIEGS